MRRVLAAMACILVAAAGCAQRMVVENRTEGRLLVELEDPEGGRAQMVTLGPLEGAQVEASGGAQREAIVRVYRGDGERPVVVQTMRGGPRRLVVREIEGQLVVERER